MPAHAGSFAISPIRLDLSTTTRSAALKVRNDAQQALVQAEIVLWEQVDGEDRLTATRDLVVSPAVFTLAENGSQLVRVALRGAPAEPARELSYRLILQEVPQSANPDFSGLQVALRLSVPVFVAQAGTTGPALTWTAEAGDGDVLVKAQNSGDAHARVLGFTIEPADGGATLAQPVAAYILPGQTHSWRLREEGKGAGPAADWRRLRLKVTTDDGDSETELDTSVR